MSLVCLFPINCPSMRGNPLQHLPLDHQTLLHGVDPGQGLIMIWITGNHRFVTSRFDTSIQFSTLWCFSLFPCVPLICIFDSLFFWWPEDLNGISWKLLNIDWIWFHQSANGQTGETWLKLIWHFGLVWLELRIVVLGTGPVSAIW